MFAGAVKRYGSRKSAVVALDYATIAFPAGKLTAVMGPSGSGKSTMMHYAAGLEIGLLRAVEASRRQLRRIAPLEMAFLSFLAASIAIAAGLGWAMIDVTGSVERGPLMRRCSAWPGRARPVLVCKDVPQAYACQWS